MICHGEISITREEALDLAVSGLDPVREPRASGPFGRRDKYSNGSLIVSCGLRGKAGVGYWEGGGHGVRQAESQGEEVRGEEVRGEGGPVTGWDGGGQDERGGGRNVGFPEIETGGDGDAGVGPRIRPGALVLG